MTSHTLCHRKANRAMNTLLAVLQFLTTLAFLVAGPVKLLSSTSLSLETLAHLDATQWMFYLSGSIGGLKLLRDTGNSIFSNLVPEPVHHS